ncbi:MAG TPA: Hsp20/alpha crystallin family protein [Deltaproteobacteria bacterium]|nr:Hsp20/alpha crystallin family protein [Deltaproteobacteria bacterium]
MESLKDKIEKEIREMRRQMLRMFQDFPGPKVMPALHSHRQGWTPPIDVYETSDEYIILVDLAGVDPKDIDIVVEDKVLRIRGRRNRPSIARATRVHEMEIDFGNFERYYRFPTPLDIARATSSYNNGLLEIVLPKKQKHATVTISLTAK